MSPSRGSVAGRPEFLTFRRLPGTGKDGAVLTPGEPRRATAGSAGLDLFVPETVVVPPSVTVIIDLLFAFAFPPGTYGQLFLRSSACGLGLSLQGGVVGECFFYSLDGASPVFKKGPSSDPDYTDSVKMILSNTSKESITLHEGIAYVQLVPIKFYGGFVCCKTNGDNDDEGMTGEAEDISDEDEGRSREIAQYLLEEEQMRGRAAADSSAPTTSAGEGNGKPRVMVTPVGEHGGFGSTGSSALNHRN